MFYIKRCDTTKERKVKVRACALKNIAKTEDKSQNENNVSSVSDR